MDFSVNTLLPTDQIDTFMVRQGWNICNELDGYVYREYELLYRKFYKYTCPFKDLYDITWLLRISYYGTTDSAIFMDLKAYNAQTFFESVKNENGSESRRNLVYICRALQYLYADRSHVPEIKMDTLLTLTTAIDNICDLGLKKILSNFQWKHVLLDRLMEIDTVKYATLSADTIRQEMRDTLILTSHTDVGNIIGDGPVDINTNETKITIFSIINWLGWFAHQYAIYLMQ